MSNLFYFQNIRLTVIKVQSAIILIYQIGNYLLFSEEIKLAVSTDVQSIILLDYYISNH